MPITLEFRYQLLHLLHLQLHTSVHWADGVLRMGCYSLHHTLDRPIGGQIDCRFLTFAQAVAIFHWKLCARNENVIGALVAIGSRTPTAIFLGGLFGQRWRCKCNGPGGNKCGQQSVHENAFQENVEMAHSVETHAWQGSGDC